MRALAHRLKSNTLYRRGVVGAHRLSVTVILIGKGTVRDGTRRWNIRVFRRRCAYRGCHRSSRRAVRRETRGPGHRDGLPERSVRLAHRGSRHGIHKRIPCTRAFRSETRKVPYSSRCCYVSTTRRARTTILGVHGDPRLVDQQLQTRGHRIDAHRVSGLRPGHCQHSVSFLSRDVLAVVILVLATTDLVAVLMVGIDNHPWRRTRASAPTRSAVRHTSAKPERSGDFGNCMAAEFTSWPGRCTCWVYAWRCVR